MPLIPDKFRWFTLMTFAFDSKIPSRGLTQQAQRPRVPIYRGIFSLRVNLIMCHTLPRLRMENNNLRSSTYISSVVSLVQVWEMILVRFGSTKPNLYVWPLSCQHFIVHHGQSLVPACPRIQHRHSSGWPCPDAVRTSATLGFSLNRHVWNWLGAQKSLKPHKPHGPHRPPRLFVARTIHVIAL